MSVEQGTPVQLISSVAELPSFLDQILAELLEGPSVRDTIERLRLGLFECRQLSGADWPTCCQLILDHPLVKLIHQDPFTHRSFTKPRGYPGDAGLIDLIYYDQGFKYGEPTPLGEAILRASRDAPAPRAVRERRDHMATLIDRVALGVPDASVLVLAAGHLREGLKSSAVMAGAVGSLVALDQDAESLKVVSESFGPRVTCVNASVRRLLAGDVQCVGSEGFDLIYAAGLLDYLGDRVALRLLEVGSTLLRPHGQLVVANFATNISDAGYMESYMDWHLIYRDRASMFNLAAKAMPRADVSCYTLASADIIYLSMTDNS